MRARRIRDKKNLLAAVKERITVMSDYLAKLKLARGKLVSVIKHVNHIYGTAYDEAISAQKESAKIMMLLGLSIGHTYNPGSEFSKIKLPREDKEDEGADDAADAAKLDAADKKGNDGKTVCENCDTETTETEPEKEPETTLMEIESSVHASMSRCKGEFCEAAYHYAFDLYKIAHNNAKHDFDDFSADKKIIAFFRTTVSKLIKRKEGRLVNLTKQADELEKSLKEAEGSDKGPLMKIIDMIADHKKRVTDSCAVMKGRSEEMIAELTSLRSCAEGKECGASDPKSQEANSDKSASEAADKLAKEGEDGAKSESATGSATGSASGGASTGASTTVAKTGATGAQNTAEAVFDESAQSK